MANNFFVCIILYMVSPQTVFTYTKINAHQTRSLNPRILSGFWTKTTNTLQLWPGISPVSHAIHNVITSQSIPLTNHKRGHAPMKPYAAFCYWWDWQQKETTKRNDFSQGGTTQRTTYHAIINHSNSWPHFWVFLGYPVPRMFEAKFASNRQNRLIITAICQNPTKKTSG